MNTSTTRVPVWHATYQGDATAAVGELIGRSGFGEQLVVLDATRNPDGSTTLGFAIATAHDFEAMVQRATAQLDLATAHPAFFGARS